MREYSTDSSDVHIRATTRTLVAALALLAFLAGMTLMGGRDENGEASSVEPSTAREPHVASPAIVATTTSVALSTAAPTTIAPLVTEPLGSAGDAPTSTVATAAPPPRARGGSPFRGAGLVDLPASCSDVEMLGLAWYYSWWHDPVCPGARAEFVPMLWGDWCANGTPCDQLPQQLVDRGVKTILGFNEPDDVEQANLSVERALDLWTVLDATSLRLGSPAVHGNAEGQAWLDAFMAGASARGLRVDFLAVHWYGDCSGTGGLVTFLDRMRTYGLPIWLTEWSCRFRPADANAAFLESVMPLIASMPSVERVAWFTNHSYANGYEHAALVTAGGQLTEVGSAYAAIPACRDARGQSLLCPAHD